MGGGGGGAGGGLITDANARLLVEDDVAAADLAFADTQDRPLIDWGTDVPPPVIEEGDGISLTLTWWRLDWGEERGSFSGSGDHPFIEDGPLFGPTLTASPTLTTRYAYSVGGAYNQPYTLSPCDWPGAWAGWEEREIWIDAVTVGTHPDDMAGIYLDVTLGGTNGYAPGANIMVLAGAPTVGRQGVVVGTAGPSGTTTVFIPAANVPAAGQHLWIGVGPSWQAHYALFGYQCAVSIHNPIFSGHYDSGRVEVSSVANARWAIYTDPGGDLGTTVELDEETDPHAGGNTLVDFGIEGSPTTEVSGGAFRVTGPGGRCLGAIGDREDEEEPAAVWGDPYNVGFEFEVSAIGSGAGHIELTTTRPGSRTVGTVHLGDEPAGISVETLTGSDYEAVAITTGERWAVRFDDRSEGWIRGKLWRRDDGEPTDWNVQVELPEDGTEDTGDRFVLCVRADTGQTITVYPLHTNVDAPGSWVREKLGVASGLSDRFTTSMEHRIGTLSFDFSGVFAPPVSSDGHEARTDYQPSAGMTVWATYLSDD